MLANIKMQTGTIAGPLGTHTHPKGIIHSLQPCATTIEGSTGTRFRAVVTEVTSGPAVAKSDLMPSIPATPSFSCLSTKKRKDAAGAFLFLLKQLSHLFRE